MIVNCVRFALKCNYNICFLLSCGAVVCIIFVTYKLSEDRGIRYFFYTELCVFISRNHIEW